MNKKDRDPEIFQFFNEIGIIEQLARARLESALPDGLKISQFTLLNHFVRLQGEWSPARLAAAFQVTKAAMTNTLQRLESRGLVTIKADPNDGRAKLVSLSPAGRKVREQCLRDLLPLFEDMQSQFGDQDFSSALPFLGKVRKFLDEHRFADPQDTTTGN